MRSSGAGNLGLGRALLRGAALVVAVAVAPAARLRAQDTVRVGFVYQPGVRPGIVVLPASAGLDSVRAIIARDLEFSDRFEVIPLLQPPPAAATASDGTAAPINYAFFRSLGASLAVELVPGTGVEVSVRLHDIVAERIRSQLSVPVDRSGAGEGRMTVHRVSDELVRLATGKPGIAATRIVFQHLGDRRIWRVDSDGAELAPVSPAGIQALSPVWSPDATKVAYVQLSNDGTKPIILQTLATGTRTVLPTTAGSQNITPTFSPDGKRLVFARMSERGVALHVMKVQELCCVEQLTGGRFAENFSPAYSPDGRRIAFVSTRAGGQQIYSMAADGTDQDLLVPFDFGSTGNSNAPEWSPDGAAIAFHREVSGTPQICLFDLASRSVRWLTSSGRNEDPSWAPDGRHLVFISNRTERRQLFVVDIETNNIRQIMTPGIARLPAWSRPLGRLR